MYITLILTAIVLAMLLSMMPARSMPDSIIDPKLKAMALAQPLQQVKVDPIATMDKIPITCRDMVIAAGIQEVEQALLLIHRESKCDANVKNPSSGACGIAQELPCGKSGCALGDGQCQISWMAKYVESRYGTWANANATWLSRCNSGLGCWY